tara:strand:- start:115 stop:864 length:750 start_codon:yes stop_codon:yes gene_type:complete
MYKDSISIIIPFYKNINLLNKAIKSVFNQTYQNYEIIIINDNNDKNCIEYLKKLKKNNKKIKIIFNKKNIGAGFSRNLGIKYSKGDYIAFLDSDDKWKKNKLSSQLKFMKKNNYLASHTSYQIVDLKNNIISTRHAKNLNYYSLLRSCDIGLSSVIFNKKIIKNIKTPFPNLKTKEDYVLWLKISKRKVTFYGLNKVLSFWTNTPNSLSKSTFQKLTDAINVYMIYEKMSFLNSIYSTFRLSINYLLKK